MAPPLVPFSTSPTEPLVPYSTKAPEPLVPYSTQASAPLVPVSAGAAEQPLVPVAAPPAEPLVPFARNSIFDPPKRRSILDQPAVGLSDEGSIFNYASPDQMDRPLYATPRPGSEGLIQSMDMGAVNELNIFGRTYTAEEIRGVEGGQDLIDLAMRARTGDRGFWEALTVGPKTDFVPYLGDIASLGISIRNMAVVRDTMAKLKEQGPDSLTLQEKVLTKLYIEDMERQSKQTHFAGTVGSIVRSAPAFAMEFFTSGAAFKAGAKAAGFAAKRELAVVVEKMARAEVASAMKSAATRLAVKTSELVIDDIGVDAIVEGAVTRGLVRREMESVLAKGGKAAVEKTAAELAADKASEEAVARALRIRARSAVDVSFNLLKDQTKVEAVGRWAGNYVRRGVFDHFDDVMRDSPVGFVNSLKEAAGVLMIEAPIKGVPYAALDFFVANPIAASLAGAKETVTRGEIGYSLSSDPDTVRRAKALAFGSAWVEYASEMGGRAFNVVGEAVGESWHAAQAKLVRGGLRAHGDAVKEGSYVQRLLEATYGTDAELKAALSRIKIEAVTDASRRPGGLVINGRNVTVPEALTHEDYVNGLIKEKLGFQQTAFMGYWVANKMAERKLTPGGMVKLLQNMGYDDLIGEWAEERYGGFLQGLVGFDNEKSRGWDLAARLKEAANQATPEQTQGWAEIVAFALPAAMRAGTSRMYASLNASAIGGATKYMQGTSLLAQGAYGLALPDRDSGAVVLPVGTTAETTNLGEMVSKGSVVTGRADLLPQIRNLAEGLADFLPTYHRTVEESSNLGLTAARWGTGILNFVVSGNPNVFYHDPVQAVSSDNLGNDGRLLMNYAVLARKQLYDQALARRATETATAELEAKKSGKTRDLSTTETRLSDPTIEREIRPALVEQLTKMTVNYLQARGAMVVTNEDITAEIDALPKDKDGKIAGRTADEFRKEFYTQLEDAARGRLRFDVEGAGDRVSVRYSAPEVANMSPETATVAKSIERFFARRGVHNVIDGTQVSNPQGYHADMAGTSMNVSDVRLAANDDGSVASNAAILRLAGEFMVNGTQLTVRGAENAKQRTVDYARTLLHINENFLKPAYQSEKDGTRYEVSGKNGALVFSKLLDAGGREVMRSGLATLADVDAFATGLGLKKQESRIFFTATNTFFANSASMLLGVPWIRNYMLDVDPTLITNPFMKRSYTDARDYVNGLKKQADALKNHEPMTEDERRDAQMATKLLYGEKDAEGNVISRGFEQAAQEAAARVGLGDMAHRSLTDRTQTEGYLVNPSAVNYGGNIYIPYRYIGNPTGLIEDAVEAKLKKVEVAYDIDPSNVVAGLFRDPMNPGQYRPAVKDFMRSVQSALSALQGSGESKDTQQEAKYLQDHMFNPDRYSMEAISHAITGFVFYRADAAVASDSNGASGSAYYATMAKVARIVRGETGAQNRETFILFSSMVNRLLDGGMLDVSSPLHDTITKFAPKGMLGQIRPSLVLSDAERATLLIPKPALPADLFTGGTPEANAEKLRKVEALLASAYAGGAVREYNYLPEDRRALARKFAAGLPTRLDTKDAAVEAQSNVGVIDQETAQDPASEPSASVNPLPGAVSPVGTVNLTEEGGASLAETLRDPRQAALAAAFAVRAGHVDRLLFGGKANAIPMNDSLAAFEFFKNFDPTLTDKDFLGFESALNAFKKKGGFKSNDDGEWFETDDSDLLTSDDDAVDNFSSNAARNHFARSPMKQAFMNIMRVFVPASMGEVTKMRDLLRRGSPELRGLDGKWSLGDLLSGVNEQLEWHPALKDEASFKTWVREALGRRGLYTQAKGRLARSLLKIDENAKLPVTLAGHEEGPAYDAFYLLLDALGFRSSYRMLTMIRGASAIGGVSLTAPSEADTKAYMRVHTRSSSVGLQPSLSMFLRGTDRTSDAGKAALAGLVKVANDLAQHHTDNPLERNDPAERLFQVFSRMLESAKLADQLFGKGNYLSDALRSEAAARRLATTAGADFLFGDGNSKYTKGVFNTYLAQAAQAHHDGAPAETVVAELFADNLTNTKQGPANVGAIYGLMFNYAQTVPMGQVAGIGRGAGTANLVSPARSWQQQRLLNSDWFRDKVLSFYPAADAKRFEPKYLARAVERARANLQWPDGTPVFSNSIGLIDGEGEEVHSSTEEADVRVAERLEAWGERKGYRSETRWSYMPMYKGDKDSALAVLVPRNDSDNRSYAERYKDLVQLMGGEEHSAKRAPQMAQGFGAVIAAPTQTRIVVAIPDMDIGLQDSQTMYGQFALAGAIGDGMKLLLPGDGRLDQTIHKYHITQAVVRNDEEGKRIVDPSVLFHKGTAVIADEHSVKDPNRTAAERWVLELALKSIDANHPSAIVTDLDSVKEGGLGDKTSIPKEVLKGRTVAEWIRDNKDSGGKSITEATLVTWKGKEGVPLSEALPGIKIERSVKTAEGGRPVTVISYTAQIVAQQAAELYHTAKPSFYSVARNHDRDGNAFQQARIKTDAVLLQKAYDKAHPDPEKPAADAHRDPDLIRAIENGEIPADSHLAKNQVVMSLGADVVTKVSLGSGFNKAVNQGLGRVLTDAAGNPLFDATRNRLQEAHPYGPPHPRSHGPLCVDKEFADQYFNGYRNIPASVAVNVRDPMFRYGLMLNLKHADFAKKTSREDVANLLIERLTALEVLARDSSAGSRFEYRRTLVEDIMPLFTDLNGNPLEPGRVFSFSDLFNAEGEFDLTALDYGQIDLGHGKSTEGVFLNGGLAIIARTPSSDGAASVLARVYAPATTSRASQIVAKVKGISGEYFTEEAPPTGPYSAADEAIVSDPSAKTYLTGNDHDGDADGVAFYALDRDGTILRGRYTDRVRARRDVTHPNKKVASASLRYYMQMFRNSYQDSRVEWLRNMPADRADGIAPKAGVAYERVGNLGSEATTTKLMTDGYDATLQEGQSSPSRDRRDPRAAARMSDEGFYGAQDRGIGVDQRAHMDTIHSVLGATLRDELNYGKGLLFDADGKVLLDGRGLTVPHTEEEWLKFSRYAYIGNNMLFDIMKGNGENARYGLLSPFINIYIPLLYAAKPKTQAEFEKFHQSFVTWVRGPMGRAMARQHEHGRDSAKSSEFANTSAGRRAAKEFVASHYEDGVPAAYLAMHPQTQMYVSAVAQAAGREAQAKGRDIGEAVRRTVDGMSALVGFSEDAAAVTDLVEAHSKNFSGPVRVETLMRSLKRANKFLKNRALLADADREDFLRQRRALLAVDFREARRRFKGHYSVSSFRAQAKKAYEQMAKEEGLANVGLARSQGLGEAPTDVDGAYDGTYRAASLERDALRASFAQAAICATPAAVGAKVEAIFQANQGVINDAYRKDRTLYFLHIMDGGPTPTNPSGNLFWELFTKYAKERVKPQGQRGVAYNAAIENLMAPGIFANRITPRAADDAQTALPKLVEGMNALKNWDLMDHTLDVIVRHTVKKTVVENGVASLRKESVVTAVITPRDMYHLLRVYATLVAPASIKVTRGTNSFLPFFGGEANAAIFWGQTDIMDAPHGDFLHNGKPNTTTVAGRALAVALGKKSQAQTAEKVDDSGTTVSEAKMGVMVPNIFGPEYGAMAWGTYDPRFRLSQQDATVVPNRNIELANVTTVRNTEPRDAAQDLGDTLRHLGEQAQAVGDTYALPELLRTADLQLGENLFEERLAGSMATVFHQSVQLPWVSPAMATVFDAGANVLLMVKRPDPAVYAATLQVAQAVAEAENNPDGAAVIKDLFDGSAAHLYRGSAAAVEEARLAAVNPDPKTAEERILHYALALTPDAGFIPGKNALFARKIAAAGFAAGDVRDDGSASLADPELERDSRIPVEALMNAEDRAIAEQMKAGAIGHTPERPARVEARDDGSASLSESDKMARYGTLMDQITADMEKVGYGLTPAQSELARKGLLRKSQASEAAKLMAQAWLDLPELSALAAEDISGIIQRVQKSGLSDENKQVVAGALARALNPTGTSLVMLSGNRSTDNRFWRNFNAALRQAQARVETAGDQELTQLFRAAAHLARTAIRTRPAELPKAKPVSAPAMVKAIVEAVHVREGQQFDNRVTSEDFNNWRRGIVKLDAHQELDHNPDYLNQLVATFLGSGPEGVAEATQGIQGMIEAAKAVTRLPVESAAVVRALNELLDEESGGLLNVSRQRMPLGGYLQALDDIGLLAGEAVEYLVAARETAMALPQAAREEALTHVETLEHALALGVHEGTALLEATRYDASAEAAAEGRDSKLEPPKVLVEAEVPRSIEAAFDKARVTFNADAHEYTVDGKVLPSVTTLIGQHPQFPFDAKTISEAVAASRGMTPEEVRKEWDDARDEGTRQHKQISDALINDTAPVDNPALAKLWSLLHSRGRVLSEVPIWNDTMAGTADIIVQRPDGSYEIYDIKTLAENPHTARFYNLPFIKNGTTVSEPRGEKHRVQLAGYRRILEDAGFRVSGTYIIPINRETERMYVDPRSDKPTIDARATERTKALARQIYGARVTPAPVAESPAVAQARAETLAAEIQATNPRTGLVEPEEQYSVSFIHPEVWFEGAVLPDFAGLDMRKLLLDKSAMAGGPQAMAAANYITSLLGVVSDTGIVPKKEFREGLALALQHGAFSGAPAADVTWFSRTKLTDEALQAATGRNLSPEEFATARWYLNAVYHYVGDGGLKGRQGLSNDYYLGDIPWQMLKSDGDVLALVNFAEANKRRRNANHPDKGARPYAFHKMLLAVRNNLPNEALYLKFEEAFQSAIIAARRSRSSEPGFREQHILQTLRFGGWALARERTEPDGSVTYYDAKVAIPVATSDANFRASSAYAKLTKVHGRTADELKIEALAARAEKAHRTLVSHARSLGWAVNGDGRLFGNFNSPTPFFIGTGAYQYYARKTETPKLPGFREAYLDHLKNLQATVESGRTMTQDKILDPETGDVVEESPGVPLRGELRALRLDEIATRPGFARMYKYLVDLHPGIFDKDADPFTVNKIIADGRAKSIGLDAKSTAWDMAVAIYRSGVLRLHTIAWNGGARALEGLDNVSLAAFNKLVAEGMVEGSSSEEMPTGARFSDIYKATGALPLNIGIDEALTKSSEYMATMVRYRAALNQCLTAVNEDGQSTVFAKPGANEDDDTVPDRVWGMVARRWVRELGDTQGGNVTYDESKSGRENASRLFDLIAADKEAVGGWKEVLGSRRQYTLVNVDVPPGMGTFSKILAMANAPGDDQKSAMTSVFSGGEAAAVMKQLLGVAGFGRKAGPGAAVVGKVLSWSKALAVQFSLFFPIATAWESPVAATGMLNTLLGFSKAGSRVGRYTSAQSDAFKKAFNVDPDAPGMREIMRIIGSDDPALVEIKTVAILAGMQFADRARNMLQVDKKMLAQQITGLSNAMSKSFGVAAGRNARRFLEAALEHNSELAFEYVINATKLAVFTQMNNTLRRQALEAGRWWDPIRSMKPWAHYINAEVGGIDPAMYPFMTPFAQRVFTFGMFSWEWTQGAWDTGGGGVLMGPLTGMTASRELRGFMPARWARMGLGIMIGVPIAIQMMATAVAKASGDDEPEDKWFTWQNEVNKRWGSANITPLIRAMGRAPAIPAMMATGGGLGYLIHGPAGALVGVLSGLGAAKLSLSKRGKPNGTMEDVKQSKVIPGLSYLIPGLTGDEGERVSSRMRQYYFNLGKQGWEVPRWFEDPVGSGAGKSSLPAQKCFEGYFGVNAANSWDMPWKESGAWERWYTTDLKKSASFNLVRSFQPFSFSGMASKPEAGFFSTLGVVTKGTSRTTAVKGIAKRLSVWAESDSYVATLKGDARSLSDDPKTDRITRGYTDLAAFNVEYLEAARRNGYPPKDVLKEAKQEACKPLYEKIHKALPRNAGDPGDLAAMREAFQGLHRLDFVEKNLLQALRERDRRQNIKRSETIDLSKALLHEAFTNPYGITGTTQDAAKGGNVAGFLSTDAVPATVLGYRVLRPEELTPEDLQFFKDNPEAAGHFRKGGGNTPPTPPPPSAVPTQSSAAGTQQE